MPPHQGRHGPSHKLSRWTPIHPICMEIACIKAYGSLQPRTKNAIASEKVREASAYRGSRQAAEYVAALGVGLQQDAVYLLRFEITNF